MTNRYFTITNFQVTRILFPGILFLLFAMGSCKNDPEEIKALTGKNTLQLDRAEDVTIIYSKRGVVTAKLFAREFIRNEAAKHPYTDMKNGVEAEFYDDSLHVENTVTARYARYYERDGYILMRDSVVIHSKKNEQLNTEELVWNQKIHKFYTEKFVKITTPTQIIYGDGLEANEDFTWYEIKNPKGSVLVNKSEVPQ
ncbi:MAG TPA: LPS export ABC transporter periplasmic protein LptC [Flavipsychrobacter sp.]|nr:LPS export ABC transporter periplasmic protein LptC [Flavipsychrobacter sp.]